MPRRPALRLRGAGTGPGGRDRTQVLFRASVRLPLPWLATLLHAAQLRLSSVVSRMAEYRADWIAASVGGTDALTRALDKMRPGGSRTCPPLRSRRAPPSPPKASLEAR